MRISKDVKLDVGVPSWHIKGHGQKCQDNYNLGYMKGTGRTCGEEIEATWSHTNPLAASVREMGPGARHETLNDHWNGWNFRKVVGLSTSSYCYCYFYSLRCTFLITLIRNYFVQ